MRPEVQAELFLKLASSSQAHLEAEDLLALRTLLLSGHDAASAVANTARMAAARQLSRFDGLTGTASEVLSEGDVWEREEVLAGFQLFDEARSAADGIFQVADAADAVSGGRRQALNRRLAAGERLTVALKAVGVDLPD